MTEQKPSRILLLEDNPDDVFLLRTTLSKAVPPIEIVAVSRLAQAIETLREGTVDLVLADLNVPDAKGAEIVTALRSENQAAPVVVLTGLDDERVREQMLGEGASACLSKDILTSPGLESAIREHLGNA